MWVAGGGVKIMTADAAMHRTVAVALRRRYDAEGETDGKKRAPKSPRNQNSLARMKLKVHRGANLSAQLHP